MAGVEILAVEQIATEYAFNWGAWALTLGVVLVFSLFVSVIYSNIDNYTSWRTAISIGLFVGVLMGGIVGLLPGFTTKPIEFKDQYKVLISEEVSMVEFMEKYEIVEQEGRIYTIEEKTE